MTCHNLRKKPLKDFEIEDLRIMVGQNMSLEFLIPLSIEILKEDILANGNSFKGDLLTNILSSNKSYWSKNKYEFEMVCNLFSSNQQRLKQFDISDEIRLEWFDLYKKFKKIK